MSSVFIILYILLIASAVIVVVLENGDPVMSHAWILTVICLPGVGLLLYFLIGKNHRKSRIITPEELAMLTTHLTPDAQPLGQEKYQKLYTIMRRANYAPLLHSYDTRIYTDFAHMYDDMLADIRQARQHVHIQFFKIEDDPVGRELGDLLIQKASEGVEVRLIYDAAANLHVDRRFYKRLKQGGVEVCSFLKVWDSLFSRDLNCRNHRKVVVIDGTVGYTGGMNIAERYRKGIHSGIWRDTHLRITGPAVGELQVAFLADWRFCTHTLFDRPHFFPLHSRPEGAVPVLTQIVTSGPMDEWNTVMQGMIQVIAQSRHYLYLQSPYFMPTQPVLVALRNAALGGVDVRLMLPERGDKGILVQWGSHSYLEEAMRAGVKVYFYTRGYLHAKTLVCDDDFVTIGSTNLDVRSFEQDFEVNAFIYDPTLAQQQRDIFLRDMDDCRAVDPKEWALRPRRQRLAESVARLFVPLL